MKKHNNGLQFLISGDWMLSRTRSLIGISFADMPKGEASMT
jgi:hypothetical protein